MILAAVSNNWVAYSLFIGKDIAIGTSLALVIHDLIFRAVGYVSVCSENASIVMKVIATVAYSAVRAVASSII